MVLGVDSHDAFKDAAGKIRDRLVETWPGFKADRLLVQRMMSGAVGEVLLGYRVDPQVGPMVLVAAGGVMTEIIRDRAIRMAPVDLDTARQMLDELQSLKLLQGFRGRPRGDLDALAKAIVSLSSLAFRPEIEELEINPLMVGPEGQGAVAVDVVARIRI